MEIGFIGLGKMGGNMATRLHQAGHTVFGTDPSATVRETTEKTGIGTADTIAHMAAKFTQKPRIFWAMFRQVR